MMGDFWEGVVWGMGFGEDSERKVKALAIESVSLKDGKIVVRIRNVGRDCDFNYLGVYLYEPLAAPKEVRLLGGRIKAYKTREELAGLVTNDWIPVNDIRVVELRPKRKLLPGRAYKVVVDWGDSAVAYNFTIDDKGGITPRRPRANESR